MGRIKQRQDLSGVLLVDKPAGASSFDVVQRLRRALRVKKVGHTGTLDPMATGLLVLCLGRATKMVPFLQAGEKTYAGTMLLGLGTDSGDITGRVTFKQARLNVDAEEIVRLGREFEGAIEQVPPAFAAFKIDGQPAYKLARRGEKVPERLRRVVVHELIVTGVDLPRVSFETRVSKGTYIRSLVVDWGRRLRTGACLEALRRVGNAPFHIDDALSLDQAEAQAKTGDLEARIIPLEEALSFMPAVRIDDISARLVENGQPLPLERLGDFTPQPGPVQILDPSAGLMAVYSYDPTRTARASACLTPLRVLTTPEKPPA